MSSDSDPKRVLAWFIGNAASVCSNANGTHYAQKKGRSINDGYLQWGLVSHALSHLDGLELVGVPIMVLDTSDGRLP